MPIRQFVESTKGLPGHANQNRIRWIWWRAPSTGFECVFDEPSMDVRLRRFRFEGVEPVPEPDSPRLASAANDRDQMTRNEKLEFLR